MVEHVNPVLLPAFATANPTVGTARILEGGAGAMVMVAVSAAPRSRMFPLGSTAPGTACAIAASTLLVVSGAACDKVATSVPPWHLLSTRPGWVTGSLGLP